MQNKNSQTIDKDSLVGATLVLVSAIAFSAKAVFVKLAYAYSVDAVTLMALRMLMSIPFFVGLAYIASHKETTPLYFRDWVMIIALGISGMYLSQLFDFIGLAHVSAGMERTILFLYPTFTVLISSLITQRPIGKRVILALVLSYSGILLVAAHELSFNNSHSAMIGAGFVFLSTLTYSSYLVGSGSVIHRIGTQRFTCYTMLVAATAVLGHFALMHPISTLEVPSRVYELGLAMAIISTVLPMIMLNAGIKRVGSSKAALISSVGPVSTVLLAAVFLNETINLRQIMGTGLVLAGVLIITMDNSRK